MQDIANATGVTAFPGLSDDELRDLYDYPADPALPWVRANFVSSIDGAAWVDGRTEGLGTPSDKKVFGILREVADVILVGAGTVRAEDYRGARTNEARREWRLANGLAAVPPIAVVSASAAIEPDSRLVTDTAVPPIVITCVDAPADRKQALTEARAQVVELEAAPLAPAAVLGLLDSLGLRRVLCEGGPSLFGELLADDAIDELCVTTSPLLVGGDHGRISLSPNAVRTPMMRSHLLLDDDGTVLARWVRAPH